MQAAIKSETSAPTQHELSLSLQQFVESTPSLKTGKVLSIEKLPGDASTRQYFRVCLDPSISGIDSLIIMVMDTFQDQGDQNPFLSIRSHLNRVTVDVPRVLDFNAHKGLILLEDLGDTTLLRNLQDVDSIATERFRFERAIDALVILHTQAGPEHATAQELKSIEGFKLRFDVDKLMWEVNFTHEHFYQKHLNRKISESDQNVLQTEFTKICTELAAQPTVFTHRDYHSRNLMIADSPAAEQPRFVMIDFQDARMGPPQYDLASLLRDSYYQLNDAQIQHLVHYYYHQVKDRGLSVPGYDEFVRLFDLMSVQRNFKAIGSFASFLNRRGNPAYLKFIGNTFENIRGNLFKYPEFSKLREVLYHYYYF